MEKTEAPSVASEDFLPGFGISQKKVLLRAENINSVRHTLNPVAAFGKICSRFSQKCCLEPAKRMCYAETVDEETNSAQG